MEVTGRVIQILPTQTFKSSRTGEEIARNTFVIEIEYRGFKFNLAFTVMKADVWQQMKIFVGNTYKVYFDVSSREWQGKWFTEAKAFRVEFVAQANNAPQPQAPTPPLTQTGSDDGTDLPY